MNIVTSFTYSLIKIFSVLFILTSITANAESNNPYALYGDWPSNNNTSDNSGVATKEKAISPKTAHKLELKYFLPTTNGTTPLCPGINITNSAAESTPVLADGIAYYTDFTGVVQAVDQKTGAVIWRNMFS